VKTGGRFSRQFFERSSLEVGPELLGAYLVRRLPDGTELAGRIVEVEAYLGDGSDAGSHTHRGETPRNRAMFGPPAHLYVYRSYGIHTCANVVCEPTGQGAALLLRALEPVAGAARMRRVRGLRPGLPDREIANGPGKLCQAMRITLQDYGRSLVSGPLTLRRPAAADPPVSVERTRRIGLSKGREHPYRFLVSGSSFVSRARPA
jgi:DNA-3-methyladenine glycosylase